MASRPGAGFDVDELDDLRIAVDEAVSALLEGGAGAPLPLTFEVESGGVVMTGETPRGPGDGLDEDRLELSTQILAAVCDEHDLSADDGKIPRADLPSDRCPLTVATPTRDREAEMARFRAHAADPSEATRATLVEEFTWVARHCARRFADRGEPFDDLFQVGMLGVLKAVDRFDPEHGTSFVSFALPTVLGELRRHFRDTTWAVRVPRRLKDLHVEVGATVEFLNNETGRAPTPEQIADHLGIGVEDVLEALDAGAAYRSSPLNMSGEREDDDAPSTVLLGDFDPDLASADDRVLLRQAMATLPARERRILELRFGEGQSQSEIAEVIGVSQVHVSRLLRKSIRLLQQQLGHTDTDDEDDDDLEAD